MRKGRSGRFLVGTLALMILPILVGASSSSGPAAVTTTQPNIVVILSDDQSPGSELEMPYLQSGRDWIKFSNAIANVSLCCPARATLLSGQYSHHTGVEDNGRYGGQYLNDQATIATWLTSAGYETALIGKYLNGYPWPGWSETYIPPGWSRWIAFASGVGYYDYTLNEDGELHHYGTEEDVYSTDVLRDKARDFIAAAGQPFFLYLALHGPHPPWTPAPRHKNLLRDREIPQPPSFNEADVSDKPAWVRDRRLLNPAEMIQQRRQEWETSLSVDDAVRAVFGALEAKGALERTVVFYLTDNGYTHGEHRLYGKRCLYEECSRLVWYVRYPGVDGRREDRLVTNVDLASTLAELGRATPTIPQDGTSLVPVIENRRPIQRNAVLTHWIGAGALGEGGCIPPYWGVRTTRYAYMELGTGEKELYDLREDPYELENIASSGIPPGLPSVLRALRGGEPGLERPCPPPPHAPAGNYEVEEQPGQSFIPGTSALPSHCDDCTTPVTFPFPVTVYGQAYASGSVDSNGTVQLGSDDTTYANVCLPASMPPSQLSPPRIIAASWDDWRTDDGGGMWTATLGSPPNRRFVIEWRKVSSPDGGRANFEVVFSESSPDISVLYGKSTTSGASSTAGIQLGGVFSDMFSQFSCNKPLLRNGIRVNYVWRDSGAGPKR